MLHAALGTAVKLDLPAGADAESRISKWCATFFFLAFNDHSGPKHLLAVIKDEQHYSLKLACELVKSLGYLFDSGSDPCLDVLATEIAETFDSRLQASKEHDMRELDKITARSFFATIGPALARSKRTSGKDFKLAMESRLLVNNLKSENLMRKIQGLTLLKDNYEITAMCKDCSHIFASSEGIAVRGQGRICREVEGGAEDVARHRDCQHFVQ